MSKGTASWLLPYPKNYYRRKCEWTGQATWGEGKSQWRKFINLCRVLKQTRAQYHIEYIDMGTHCKALVRWTGR